MKPEKHRSLKKKKARGILEPNRLLALPKNIQEKILAGRRRSQWSWRHKNKNDNSTYPRSRKENDPNRRNTALEIRITHRVDQHTGLSELYKDGQLGRWLSWQSNGYASVGLWVQILHSHLHVTEHACGQHWGGGDKIAESHWLDSLARSASTRVNERRCDKD